MTQDAFSGMLPDASPKGPATGHKLSPAVALGLAGGLDLALVVAAGMAAQLARFRPVAPTAATWLGMALALLLTLNLFHAAGLYRFALLTSLFEQASRLLVAWT